MRAQRQRIVAGNWKMNGSRHFVEEYVAGLSGQIETVDSSVEIVIMPPALFVSELREQIQKRTKKKAIALNWGVQNISPEESGAFTGEISAGMARDQGCTYCILGHSERRQLFGETDPQIAAKTLKAVHAGLTAMVCVGETLIEREGGHAESVVARQVQECLSLVPANAWDKIVLAYEPVWAIGTGKTASAADAQAIHASIRKVLEKMQAPATTISLLYGGSVKPDNAKELFSQPDIDGGLIGGASLDAEAFAAICRAC